VDDVVGKAARRITIGLSPDADLEPIRQALASAGGGQGEVTFRVPLAAGGEAEIALEERFAITPVLEDVLSAEAGVRHVAME